ncbi:MAG: 2OG-Fe(II) oxygenase [Parvularculaceae bacterium]
MVSPSTIENLRKRAEAGEAGAQYALAAALSKTGARDEADRWLNAAAEQDDGDALYTLATRLFDDQERIDEAASLLGRAADNGSTIAQRLLGALYADGVAVSRDWAKAVSLVATAAQSGDASAMREVAILLFAEDPDDPDGAALIAEACSRDAVAAAVAVRRAARQRKNADTTIAAEAMRNLDKARYPNAAALRTAFQANRVNAVVRKERPDWNRVVARLSSELAPPVENSETICETPYARVYRQAFTLEECEYVIAASARHLAPSLIVDPQTGQSRKNAYRTSLTAVLGCVDLDLALVMFNRRMASLAGRPAENGEFLSVLCYGAGQEYRPHFDWLPTAGEEYDRSGQRVATALLYLNEEYQGGETHFLTPDIRFKGGAGDVLVFDNVHPDGEPDKACRHASLPVSDGVKWIGSKWFREKKYNF